jgi:hypothetical protein
MPLDSNHISAGSCTCIRGEVVSLAHRPRRVLKVEKHLIQLFFGRNEDFLESWDLFADNFPI